MLFYVFFRVIWAIIEGMKELFGDNVRRLMDVKDVTAKDLSQKLKELNIKVSARTIQGWTDARKCIPSAYVSVAVARIFKTTVEYLVEGDKGIDYIYSVLYPKTEPIVYHAAETPAGGYGDKNINVIIQELKLLTHDDLCDVQALVSSKAARRRPAKLS
jgi:hypothetical protein